MKHQLYLTVSLIFISFFTNPTNTFAHCDSIEGPVVIAAKKALETGNLNYVLLWVSEDDETELKNMFDRIVKVRHLNEDVRSLADMYFFETVVRVHRMGEGVGYTGLKSNNFEPTKGIEAADIAVERNSIEDLLSHLDESQHSSVQHYFSDLQSKRNYEVNDLRAGREYVKSYVHFIHFVESLFNSEDENGQHKHQEHVH